MKDIKILAIETSCDETAASVIGVSNCHSELISESQKDKGSRNKFGMTALCPAILSNVVNSQIDLHAKTGGVVPEVASRAHMENIVPVITEALLSAVQKISNSKFLISNKNLNDQMTNDKINDQCELENDKYFEAIEWLQNNITHVAVTAGPGLIGSLLVGFNAAKAIAYSLDKPIIPINHIEGHIYSAFGGVQEWTTNKTNHETTNSLSGSYGSLSISDFEFPILALTVSGGHTSLTLMSDHGKYERIGGTLDDAAGEAFDKVAKLLGLSYPGGPEVSRMADKYRRKKLSQKWTTNKTNHETTNSLSGSYGSLSISDKSSIKFPRPILNDGTFNFSFSGLKTAVLQKVIDIRKNIYYSCHPELVSGSHNKKMLKQVQHDINGIEIPENIKEEICAAFEDAVVDVLATKMMRAVEKYKPKTLVLAGGVAANKRLREVLKYQVSGIRYQGGNRQPNLLIPPINLCGDNAAMIGLAAFYHLQKGDIYTWKDIIVDSNLELGART